MNSGRYTLDRIVDGKAASLLLREDETKEVIVSLEELPGYAKEGDILNVMFHDDQSVEYAAVLEKETKGARKKAEDLLQKILNKDNK